MRSKNILRFIPFILLLLLAPSWPCFSAEIEVDGEVKNGYRILTLQQTDRAQNFHVYRGDYIKFKLPDQVENTEIIFPTLNERKPISTDLELSSYIKMKKLGKFPFEIDKIKGTVTVIEYQQSSYKTLTAKEARSFIEENTPLILDVRTPQEYKAGHIENAVLLPVQLLQSNLKKLGDYKDKPILIYCATGNRSTVASKILIDTGFKQILNLKKGIEEWHKKGFSVTR